MPKFWIETFDRIFEANLEELYDKDLEFWADVKSVVRLAHDFSETKHRNLIPAEGKNIPDENKKAHPDSSQDSRPEAVTN